VAEWAFLEALGEGGGYPLPYDAVRVERVFEALEGRAVAEALSRRPARDLIESLAGNSAFLSRLIIRAPETLERVLARDPGAGLEALLTGVADAAGSPEDPASKAAHMTALRRAKAEASLLIALADLSGLWGLENVTGALTRFADACLSSVLSRALWEAGQKGRVTLADPQYPEQSCGIAVIAMGKYGAFELNYSSDIDLVVIYESSRVPVGEEGDARAFAIDLTKGLVSAMADKTGDGYVFRTDLRLRPDPSATPPAVSAQAAEQYYEALGQNWERAAYIKARPAAGDRTVGEAFLKALRPFVWRRHLDFAAIEDIHSIKRQIHAAKGHGAIAVEGHNIKLGRGGIREIEFFAQTQQLIAGGRNPDLREPRTLAALDRLVDAQLIEPEVRGDLHAAYDFLRRLEHRLQMVEDAQTHALPKTAEGVDHIARFMAYPHTDEFRKDLLAILNRVHKHYSALFETSAPLSEETGSLVFTGVEDDPETLETIAALGFKEPAKIADLIRGWHRGRVRATRSERARELLTSLVPAILKTFAATRQPDEAFIRFDRFLSGLPGGVQVFSLLASNPDLLTLLAECFAAAPRLAGYLSRHPGVLDALLDPDYLALLPDTAEVQDELGDAVARMEHYEAALDEARRVSREQRFRVGLQVLRGGLGASRAGEAFSDLADAAIHVLQPRVETELAARHGRVPDGDMAVVAFGRLGAREMTATSDLDLVFVYTHPHDFAASDGRSSLHAPQYFTRLSQRLINALSAPTAEGELYEVDMRLRPSGRAGPVATRLSAFIRYYEEDAWTWELMALTRARVVTGSETLRRRLEKALRDRLTAKRNTDDTFRDAAEMRTRLEREFPGRGTWDMKHGPGGLTDLSFLVQALQLAHAHDHPEILTQNLRDGLERLREAGVIREGAAERLVTTARMLQNLNQILAIAVEGQFDPYTAGPVLRERLARACEISAFDGLEGELAQRRAEVRALIEERIGKIG